MQEQFSWLPQMGEKEIKQSEGKYIRGLTDTYNYSMRAAGL